MYELMASMHASRLHAVITCTCSLAAPDVDGGRSGEDVNLTMSILMHNVVQLA